jgi:hypothetical protein
LCGLDEGGAPEEGSMESLRFAAGARRELPGVRGEAMGFAGMAEAVIGMRDGGASDEVRVSGEGGRSSP